MRSKILNINIRYVNIVNNITYLTTLLLNNNSKKIHFFSTSKPRERIA